MLAVIGRAIVVATAVLGTSWSFGAPAAVAATCATSPTAAGLDTFFRADDAAGLAGADYPHAYPLPDGRTLWLFQDAFVGPDDQLGDDRFAHNAALVQSGDCFELLPTSGGSGTSWIGSWVESELEQWFWPLDAEVGADGYLWLFLAEVRNPNGSGAAIGAEPVATWRARYRLPELELVDLEPAADASSALFGYSIVSDDDWTYLYGHCYKQYVPETGSGFDPSCSPYAYVARVPRGQLDRRPQYWSGAGWTARRSARKPVLTGAHSMPVSVERFGAIYVAASDENDWFGPDVVIRTAPEPQGPWTEVLRYTPETRCGEGCNNYGAFVLPRLEDDQVVIAHSNNAWDMRNDAFADASLYRIGVRALSVPGVPAPEPAPEPPAPIEDEVTELDGSLLETTSRHGTPRWSDHVLGALRIAGLGLAATVALAATTGFATTARRAAPHRRRHALVRLRTTGATRAHGPLPSRERVGAGDR
jgi:hypothetical protein